MQTIDPAKNETLGISDYALKNRCACLNYMGLLKFKKGYIFLVPFHCWHNTVAAASQKAGCTL